MKLDDFIGKPVTILTTPINRDFKAENPKTYPRQLHVYFVGIFQEADHHGVWIRQIISGKMSFFPWNHIVSIAEEEALDPNNEEDRKIIDSMIEIPEPQSVPMNTGEGSTISPDLLADMQKQVTAEEAQRNVGPADQEGANES